ncbi:MAG: four helix bundle protein [Deltaproteobacteria bacterium]|nr:four helix bundle protein [Deltaproteobacteria bacterium]
MNNKDFAKTLEERTKQFANRIIRLSMALPKSPEALVVRNQITKSGTSIRANYREANRSRSKADFINRIKICESEASETQYWLELIIAADWLSKEKAGTAHSECSELLAIFASITRKNK